MSDYARVYDFSVKDGLTTGDPAKLIKGSEVDAEFDELVIHVASKIDTPAGASEGDFLTLSSGSWSGGSAGIVPVGALMPYGGSAAPTDWLLCDGSSMSTTTYAALFAVIGYTYGGSGANFNLPDLRGRTAFGKDNMNNVPGTGGGDAGRLTSGSASSFDGDTLGATGGDEEHTLTTAQLAAHTHGFKVNVNDAAAGSDEDAPFPTGGTTRQTESAGSGNPHNNVPPGIVLNYIIYHG